MPWRSHLSNFLTHDFSPWANRYVYWVKSPLGLLIVAAVVALICGLFVANQGLVVFAAITMVIGVVVGTYSTIFVATPLVVWWHGRSAKS